MRIQQEQFISAAKQIIGGMVCFIRGDMSDEKA